MDKKLLSLIIFLALLNAGSCKDDSLRQYLQPSDVLSGAYDETYLSTNSSLCTRQCTGASKICYYEFFTEMYSSMGLACKDCPFNREDCFAPQCVTVDGVPRGIVTYNRIFPGPSIQVCKGDVIVVDVHNHLPSDSTSIHWHGIRHKNSPYYDGVPKVTQCPIHPGTTFRYIYNASEEGTFFYHSHSGLQKVDGLSGTLIVREKKEDEHISHLYDFDLPSHTVMVSDWMHLDSGQFLPGITNERSLPKSYLVNGRGIFAPTGQSVNIDQGSLPLTEFTVKKGKRYRFRLIGGTCLACLAAVTFLDHRVSVVFGDGAGPVEPTLVDKIVLNSGDRFDVILEANQSVDTYWIMVRGLGGKNSSTSCYNAQQFALLKYEGHNGKPSTPYPGTADVPEGITLNPENSSCNDPNEVCLTHLQSFTPLPEDLKGKPDEILFVRFSNYRYEFSDLFENGTFQPFFVVSPAGGPIKSLVNNVMNFLPPSPLMSQYEDVPNSSFCRPECYSKDIQKPCTCLNVLKVKLNSVVDVILTGTGVAHPFHLHGYNFYIMEEGSLEGDVENGLKNLVKRLMKGDWHNSKPIQKDTVGVPHNGYVVVRFKADNPGLWFFHCHFLFHLDSGMSGILQVGEPSDFQPVPEGFPKCGDFLPPLPA
ncbi:laccase-5-like [Cimex lectularius]|uniref:Multicopper oxidase n=1 Tax=Cimex lectularius TaxID=79782 RepID=A0A8I6R8N0_CIMLE|nr:laccase-5-like [Cimex lectularius]